MKDFNVTGVCIPQKHYMVDITKKLDEIFKLIEKEAYFTINRARQYGKTTTFSQIYLKLKDQYLVLDISFEGIGEKPFSSENAFIETFIDLISKRLKQNKVDKNIIAAWEEQKTTLEKLEELSDKITQLADRSEKEIILLIDEVDKSSDNQLFLHFLGLLRSKYLDRSKGYDSTFKSVILAGVYDVKNLKIKLRPEDEKKFNSPWNIAADFDVDMSFNPSEIATMLIDYQKINKTVMDITAISNELFKFTSGYPFLISRLCKLVDEKLYKNWSLKGIEEAVKLLLNQKNTLFDDLIKNLENNKEIFNTVYNLIIENETMQFNPHAYDLGIIFGIFKNDNGVLAVHNKIFEVVLFNYLIAKKHSEELGKKLVDYTSLGIYEKKDESLDIKKALIKYQEFMKSVYGKFDKDFIERQGRLLLLAFFKPILNGKGFYFVESQTGFEQRQDVVITFGKYKYIIELKIWRGEEYHQKGILQLEHYLHLESTDEGFLVVYNKNNDKEFKSEIIKLTDKEIFSVWV